MTKWGYFGTLFKLGMKPWKERMCCQGGDREGITEVGEMTILSSQKLQIEAGLAEDRNSSPERINYFVDLIN